MEGGLFHFLMSLTETMNYAHKHLFHFLMSLTQENNYARKDQVLPKDQVILGIVAPESKSYLTWKPVGCQGEGKGKTPMSEESLRRPTPTLSRLDCPRKGTLFTAELWRSGVI
jgi:hypothetical protein